MPPIARAELTPRRESLEAVFRELTADHHDGAGSVGPPPPPPVVPSGGSSDHAAAFAGGGTVER
jgi:hypothetical protein